MTITKNPRALSWKHPGVSGIETKANRQGEQEIISWPLGPVPSQTTVDGWETEYNEAQVDERPKQAVELNDDIVMLAKWLAPLHSKTEREVYDELIAIRKTMMET